MSPPANFTEGTPIPGEECWYTVLTNERHITSSGTVHSQALKGRRIAPVQGKAWSHELSGRIVSLSGDVAAIEADARGRCANTQANYARTHNGVAASNIVFAGVACAEAAELRTTIRGALRVDVVYTPQPPTDNAHSDVAVFNAANNDSDIEAVRDWLLRKLRAIRPDNLTAVTA